MKDLGIKEMIAPKHRENALLALHSGILPGRSEMPLSWRTQAKLTKNNNRSLLRR